MNVLIAETQALIPAGRGRLATIVETQATMPGPIWLISSPVGKLAGSPLTRSMTGVRQLLTCPGRSARPDRSGSDVGTEMSGRNWVGREVLDPASAASVAPVAAATGTEPDGVAAGGSVSAGAVLSPTVVVA